MQQIKNVSISEILIVLLLWFSAFVKYQDESLTTLSLYVAMPIAALISALKWGITIKDNKYFTLLLGVYLISLFTSFTGMNFALSMDSMKTMLGASLLSFIVFKASSNAKIIPFLYITYIILYASAWLYAKDNILSLSDFDISNSRMNDDKLNANHMAYYTFYFTIIVYLFGDILRGKLSKFFIFLFWLLYPLSFWVSIFTASRQVLILQIPLLLILTYKRYFKDNRSPIKIVILLLFVGAFFCLYDYVLDIFSNSMLAKRSEVNAQEDIRHLLLQEALKVGFENPIVGVGPACTTLVLPRNLGSHCTYTELFACSGILAPILYIIMLCKFVVKQISLYNRTNDKTFWLFIIFGLFFAFDNFFYMFHYDIWLMSFFILVCSHSISYKKQVFNILSIPK